MKISNIDKFSKILRNIYDDLSKYTIEFQLIYKSYIFKNYNG